MRLWVIGAILFAMTSLYFCLKANSPEAYVYNYNQTEQTKTIGVG